jgi:hypothetical protein
MQLLVEGHQALQLRHKLLGVVHPHWPHPRRSLASRRLRVLAVCLRGSCTLQLGEGVEGGSEGGG